MVNSEEESRGAVDDEFEEMERLAASRWRVSGDRDMKSGASHESTYRVPSSPS